MPYCPSCRTVTELKTCSTCGRTAIHGIIDADLSAVSPVVSPTFSSADSSADSSVGQVNATSAPTSPTLDGGPASRWEHEVPVTASAPTALPGAAQQAVVEEADTAAAVLSKGQIRWKGVFRLIMMAAFAGLLEWNLAAPGAVTDGLAGVVVLIGAATAVIIAFRGLYWVLLPSLVARSPRHRRYGRSSLIYLGLLVAAFAPSLTTITPSPTAGSNGEQTTGTNQPPARPLELNPVASPVRLTGADTKMIPTTLVHSFSVLCGDEATEIAYPVTSGTRGTRLVAPLAAFRECQGPLTLSDGLNTIPVTVIGTSGEMIVLSVPFDLESFNTSLTGAPQRALVWSDDDIAKYLAVAATIDVVGYPVLDAEGSLVGFTDGAGGVHRFVDKDFR